MVTLRDINEKKLSKTQQAVDFVNNYDGEIKNRGHLSVLLKQAGIDPGGRGFNAAAKAAEEKSGSILGKSKGAKQKDEIKALYTWSAQEVLDHIDSIKKPDHLFWAAWKLFKDERKWANKLKTSDFAVHFNKR